MFTLTSTIHSSRGLWPALRAALALSLCLGLTAAFLAEVWHGPAAHPSEAGSTMAAGGAPSGAGRS